MAKPDTNSETLMDLPSGGKISAPKGTKAMLSKFLPYILMTAVGFGGGGAAGTVLGRESPETTSKLEGIEGKLDKFIEKVEPLLLQRSADDAKNSERDRRITSVEAKMDVLNQLLAAHGEKFVRREEYEENKRQLSRALQDIAELKAKVK